jgi:hypothetical protein
VDNIKVAFLKMLQFVSEIFLSPGSHFPQLHQIIGNPRNAETTMTRAPSEAHNLFSLPGCVR